MTKILPQIFFLIIATVALSGCKEGELTVTDRASGSDVSFAGIASIDNINGVSARLNWASTGTAAQYFVYNVTSGNAVYVAAVPAPATSYTVTGLLPATSYTFRVRMVNTNAVADINTNDKIFTTASVTASFNGWTAIKALGPKTPSAQASDLSSTSASATLSWADVTLSSGTVSSYNIYRAASSAAQDYTSPLATGITTSSRTYTDTSVVKGQTYYYTVAPVVAGSVLLPTWGADSEVKVIVPKDNMVLVHRWAANQEMCGLMGKTPDRNNNYRCMVLTGSNAPPGTDNSGYNDLGASIFVDMFEQGCNYTYSSTLSKCGSADGCIGTASTPNGVVTGNAGDIYYSRQSAQCFINTSGTTGTAWTVANSATAPQRQTMGSASPGLPPFAVINQTGSQDICSGQTVSGFSGTKRLLKRKEQLLAAAWDSSLNDTTIAAMEVGTNLDSTHYCNSSYASPQGNTTTDISGSNPTLAYSNLAMPTAKDTLPGCRFGDCASTASTIRSVRTGSVSTNQCLSRYGAQDMVGNVWEWTSDQLSCNGTSCAGVSAASNTADPTNGDFVNSIFNGTQGPVADGTFTSFGKLQFPLGTPVVSAGFAGDGVVSLTSTQLHGDYFFISSAASGVRGAYAGGSWVYGSNSGRFALALNNVPAGTNTSLGFRCALPAE